jgi:hypothetical protein
MFWIHGAENNIFLIVPSLLSKGKDSTTLQTKRYKEKRQNLRKTSVDSRVYYCAVPRKRDNKNRKRRENKELESN